MEREAAEGASEVLPRGWEEIVAGGMWEDALFFLSISLHLSYALPLSSWPSVLRLLICQDSPLSRVTSSLSLRKRPNPDRHRTFPSNATPSTPSTPILLFLMLPDLL